jgi:hypothetical protein
MPLARAVITALEHTETTERSRTELTTDLRCEIRAQAALLHEEKHFECGYSTLTL